MPLALPSNHPQRDLAENIRDTLDMVAIYAHQASATNQEQTAQFIGSDEQCAAAECDPLYLTLTNDSEYVSGHGYLALVKIEERLRERYKTIAAYESLKPEDDHNPPWAFSEFHQGLIPDLRDLPAEKRENEPWWATAIEQENALTCPG